MSRKSDLGYLDCIFYLGGDGGGGGGGARLRDILDMRQSNHVFGDCYER